MTLARSKEALVAALQDHDNQVIALSGRWGTGKTYLWETVREKSSDDRVRQALRVSLFGATSISELQLRLVQAILQQNKGGGNLVERLKRRIPEAARLLKSIWPQSSTLEDLAPLVVPGMIAGRFIVIDDVERKHGSLCVDQILGFLDESVRNQGCRFLLILNSDELADQKIWHTIREKVLDQEVGLAPSPAEAVEIALKVAPTRYAQQITAAAEACGVTNIRILCRIVRVVNRILADHDQLADEVLVRVIPSTVLLSAIHYNGLEDGPSFDWVLGFESAYLPDLRKRAGIKAGADAADNPSLARWRLLMDRLGIRGVDGFEALVVQYLKSGLLHGEELAETIRGYVTDHVALVARDRAQKLLEDYRWRVDLSDAQRLEHAENVAQVAGYLDMFTATQVHDRVAELPGGTLLADDLIERWLSAFNARNPPGRIPTFGPDFNDHRRPLHPRLDEAVRAVLTREHSTMTVLDICRKVCEQESWGPREVASMRSITAEDYEGQIRAATGPDLKLLLQQSIEFLRRRQDFANFGDGIDSFQNACRKILALEPQSRLGRLIAEEFAKVGIQHYLRPPAPRRDEEIWGASLSPERPRRK